MSYVLEPNTDISMTDFSQIVEHHQTVRLSATYQDEQPQQDKVISEMLQKGTKIYGMNTGFGAMAYHCVDISLLKTHQTNLLYHLASGVGAPYLPQQSRAIMFTRLVQISRPYRCISHHALSVLCQWLNNQIAAVIPTQGTVGASGDLTPLAHMTLSMLGEGKIFRKKHIIDAKQLLKELSIPCLTLKQRDGLGLVNGTAAMTALAGLNHLTIARLHHLAVCLAALNIEVLQGYKEAHHLIFGKARPFKNQLQVAKTISEQLAKSPRAQQTPVKQSLPQDVYSMRCSQQLLGAVKDTIDFHEKTVKTELNSCTDNPLFDIHNEQVWHGGNFLGQQIALASDHLALAVSQMANHSERIIARLANHQYSNLPDYLTTHSPGLNSGYMGAQVTATALLAEIRSLAMPASLHSITTNNDNQDIVSMGTIAARKTSHLIEMTSKIVSIEAMMLSQAMTLIGLEHFSPNAKSIYHIVRQFHPPLTSDRPLSQEIEQLSAHIRAHGLSRQSQMSCTAS